MLKVMLGLAVAAGLLFAQETNARTLPGLAGVAVPASDAACFVSSNGVMRNNCTSKADLAFALPVDSHGLKVISLTASATGPSTNVGCNAYAVNRDGTIASSTVGYWLNQFGPVVTMTMSAINVPINGTLYVSCYVGPGGRIYGVEYNQ
ncbi:hypothetical protein ACLESD_02745 [Pyxidicoccus sp. 3LFB2]